MHGRVGFGSSEKQLLFFITLMHTILGPQRNILCYLNISGDEMSWIKQEVSMMKPFFFKINLSFQVLLHLKQLSFQTSADICDFCWSNSIMCLSAAAHSPLWPLKVKRHLKQKGRGEQKPLWMLQIWSSRDHVDLSDALLHDRKWEHSGYKYGADHCAFNCKLVHLDGR